MPPDPDTFSNTTTNRVTSSCLPSDADRSGHVFEVLCEEDTAFFHFIDTTTQTVLWQGHVGRCPFVNPHERESDTFSPWLGWLIVAGLLLWAGVGMWRQRRR